MPRRAREKSVTGVYHVMVRGINKQPIFKDETDCKQYLCFLAELMYDMNFMIYAFCLMVNHVHLLISVDSDKLSLMMKRLGTRYAYYYNSKYGRVGHLFQDRFKSEVIDTEKYLFAVLRYIHQNPVKAKMVNKAADYHWSSYGAYLDDSNCFSSLVETKLFLDMLGPDRLKAKQSFEELMSVETEECFLEDDFVRYSDEQLKEEIIKMIGGLPLSTLQSMESIDLNNILRKLKEKKGVSARQIARVTGLNRGKVQRV